MGVLYTALIGFGCISHSLQKGYLYTYTHVGLSALYQRVHSKMIFLICYLLDYQQVHENTNVSIILLGDKKEPTK